MNLMILFTSGKQEPSIPEIQSEYHISWIQYLYLTIFKKLDMSKVNHEQTTCRVESLSNQLP